MENFREFLDGLGQELSTWTANDGGLTLAASDELSAVAWWASHVNESRDELLEHLDFNDLNSWSWTDNQVHEFLAETVNIINYTCPKCGMKYGVREDEDKCIEYCLWCELILEEEEATP